MMLLIDIFNLVNSLTFIKTKDKSLKTKVLDRNFRILKIADF